VQSSETKPSRAAFDRESHRAAAAAFEAKNVEQPLVDVAASYPKGRILPSLVADKPLGRLLRDASLSAAESGANFYAAQAAVSAAPKGQGPNVQPTADGVLVCREHAARGPIVGHIPSTIGGAIGRRNGRVRKRPDDDAK
jgi:hypothetical protein